MAVCRPRTETARPHAWPAQYSIGDRLLCCRHGLCPLHPDAARPEVFTQFHGVQVIPRPSSYIGFVTGFLFWIGITFEFPLVIYGLTLMGIIQPESLFKYWRIAVIVIAVLASAITPTTDPVNMALVMGPMILLYFLNIGLGYLALVGRRRKAQAVETT